MHVTGIIAEYNPFHNGHAYHIRQTKALAGGYVLALMSGDFVQRGEPALLSKHIRARHALLGGADMVIELPTVFALGSAPRFAQGAVALLEGTGMVDALSFGSEAGDLGALRAAAQSAAEAPAQRALLRKALKAGHSYPAALAAAGHSAGAFGPNDTLAVEYLRALGAKSAIRPICVPRQGAAHDSTDLDAGTASASALRRLVRAGDAAAAAGYVPAFVAADIQPCTPRDADALSDAILYALRRLSREQLAQLPDVTEGLENVLYREARACTDYAGFLRACKTRRYTLARLRRISMCALLGITTDLYALPPYIRVLGMRAEAEPLLSALCARAELPVVTRFAQTRELPPGAARLHEIDSLAGAVACMAATPPAPAAFDYAQPMLIV